MYGAFAPTQAWQPSSASPPAQLPSHSPVAPPAPPATANLPAPIDLPTREQQRPHHSTRGLAAEAPPPGAQAAKPAAVQMQPGGVLRQQGSPEQDLVTLHGVQPSRAGPEEPWLGENKDAGLASPEQLRPAAPRPVGSASDQPLEQRPHQPQGGHQPAVPLVAPCTAGSGDQRPQQWAGGQPHAPPCVSGPASAAAPRLGQQQSRLSVSTLAVCAGMATHQSLGNQNLRLPGSGAHSEALSPADRPSTAQVRTLSPLQDAQESHAKGIAVLCLGAQVSPVPETFCSS